MIKKLSRWRQQEHSPVEVSLGSKAELAAADWGCFCLNDTFPATVVLPLDPTPIGLTAAWASGPMKPSSPRRIVAERISKQARCSRGLTYAAKAARDRATEDADETRNLSSQGFQGGRFYRTRSSPSLHGVPATAVICSSLFSASALSFARRPR